MSAPIDLHVVRKTYRGAEGGTVEAVRNLSLQVPGGGFTALIGPSGCGKTTSLRILAGLDTDFEGRVGLPKGTRIGFVFQEPRLLPWRTVEANTRIVVDRPEVFDPTELFTELGLLEMRNRFPTELSLGLARRVALGRALAIEPDVLILDEPLTSLDEMTALRLRHLIVSIWALRRPTTVMVTHNIREALQMADRILLLAPRPSRVVAEIAIDTPHAERGEAFLEAKRSEMMARWPALVA